MRTLTLICLAVVLASCGANPDKDYPAYVMPMSDGTQTTTTSDPSREKSQHYAILFSRAACRAEGKRLLIINNDTSKKGTIKSEAANDFLNRTALLTGNGVLYGLGGEYTTTINFRCEGG